MAIQCCHQALRTSEAHSSTGHLWYSSCGCRDRNRVRTSDPSYRGGFRSLRSSGAERRNRRRRACRCTRGRRIRSTGWPGSSIPRLQRKESIITLHIVKEDASIKIFGPNKVCTTTFLMNYLHHERAKAERSSHLFYCCRNLANLRKSKPSSTILSCIKRKQTYWKSPYFGKTVLEMTRK